jgi:hypothetical protein
MNRAPAPWHLEVLDKGTNRALRDLNAASLLGGFYLAGGTGLALSLGHRRSMDLDFFTEEPFDSDRVTGKLRDFQALRVLEKSEGTLHVSIGMVKISFLSYPYPLLFACQLLQGVEVADPRDVACMKLSAIASRGTRRDFIDFFAVVRVYGLAQILEWFAEKFRQVSLSRVHLLKSLTYFEDARHDPMPDMLIPLSWEDVEAFFSAEVPKLL